MSIVFSKYSNLATESLSMKALQDAIKRLETAKLDLQPEIEIITLEEYERRQQ